MCMDRVVDCAELPRIAFWIFFEIDPGSWSDGQYFSRKGKTIGTDIQSLIDAPPLALGFYNTSKAKTSGHVAVRFSEHKIIQSGAREHDAKVGISSIYWRADIYLRTRTFLTKEEIDSVITGEPEDERMIVYFNNEQIAELGKDDVLTIKAKEEPIFKKAVCTANVKVNVRDGRGQDFKDIGDVYAGETVEVIDKTLDLEYIEITWDGGVGYAYSENGRYFQWEE